MATNKNPQGNPSLAEEPAHFPQSQAQSTSAEPEHKRRNAPDKVEGTQFFDTTIAKIKEIDGEKVVVMSDHLDPGEETKQAYDDRRAEEKLRKTHGHDEDAHKTEQTKAAEAKAEDRK